jgi:hypothetical protein
MAWWVQILIFSPYGMSRNDSAQRQLSECPFSGTPKIPSRDRDGEGFRMLPSNAWDALRRAASESRPCTNPRWLTGLWGFIVFWVLWGAWKVILALAECVASGPEYGDRAVLLVGGGRYRHAPGLWDGA